MGAQSTTRPGHRLEGQAPRHRAATARATRRDRSGEATCGDPDERRGVRPDAREASNDNPRCGSAAARTRTSGGNAAFQDDGAASARETVGPARAVGHDGGDKRTTAGF
jgi:hypothetical protein